MYKIFTQKHIHHKSKQNKYIQRNWHQIIMTWSPMRAIFNLSSFGQWSSLMMNIWMSFVFLWISIYVKEEELVVFVLATRCWCFSHFFFLSTNGFRTFIREISFVHLNHLYSDWEKATKNNLEWNFDFRIEKYQKQPAQKQTNKKTKMPKKKNYEIYLDFDGSSIFRNRF